MRVLSDILGAVIFFLAHECSSFSSKVLLKRPYLFSRVVASQCICINCKFVDRCTSYHFVEEKHDQPHLNKSPDFTPRPGSPRILVAIRRDGEPGARRSWDTMLHGGERRLSTEPSQSSEGVTSIEVPVFTTEYDVVECEDYVEESGRWVRKMPSEIREANPGFVPT